MLWWCLPCGLGPAAPFGLRRRVVAGGWTEVIQNQRGNAGNLISGRGTLYTVYDIQEC